MKEPAETFAQPSAGRQELDLQNSRKAVELLPGWGYDALGTELRNGGVTREGSQA
jgi:hypothetical protein